MMKKLLVLMLVLGMVSVANAGLISVVIDHIEKHPENTGPPDVVEPSDMVYIKIVSQVTLDSYAFDLHVTGPGVLQEVDGGPAQLTEKFGPGSGTWIPVNRQNADDFYFGGNDSLWGYGGIVNNKIDLLTWASLDYQFDPGDLIWGLAIHCDGPGDVIVDLTQDPTGYTGTTTEQYGEEDFDDLIIPQIPEPMTMVLLGLGGLFLRRRK
jgi:hypothetical protein